jgi:hypothetical protein
VEVVASLRVLRPEEVKRLRVGAVTMIVRMEQMRDQMGTVTNQMA